MKGYRAIVQGTIPNHFPFSSTHSSWQRKITLARAARQDFLLALGDAENTVSIGETEVEEFVVSWSNASTGESGEEPMFFTIGSNHFIEARAGLIELFGSRKSSQMTIEWISTKPTRRYLRQKPREEPR